MVCVHIKVGGIDHDGEGEYVFIGLANDMDRRYFLGGLLFPPHDRVFLGGEFGMGGCCCMRAAALVPVRFPPD